MFLTNWKCQWSSCAIQQCQCESSSRMTKRDRSNNNCLTIAVIKILILICCKILDNKEYTNNQQQDCRRIIFHVGQFLALNFCFFLYKKMNRTNHNWKQWKNEFLKLLFNANNAFFIFLKSNQQICLPFCKNFYCFQLHF